ncbi:unnamed protein product [Lampetra fluviatilis]
MAVWNRAGYCGGVFTDRRIPLARHVRTQQGSDERGLPAAFVSRGFLFKPPGCAVPRGVAAVPCRVSCGARPACPPLCPPIPSPGEVAERALRTDAAGGTADELLAVAVSSPQMGERLCRIIDDVSFG